jgi:crotonobetainyl-CoA:carnitine CoA-transferase CaiB-like acyl-CoA transferase
VDDGYRESAESWKTLLRDLKRRGMAAPVVAVGDGALGFWAAAREVWPETREQVTHNNCLTLAAMGANPQRNGNEFGFAVPSNVFACTDGSVYIAVLLDAHWKVLARTIGHAEFADDPRFATISGRGANRDACNAIVASWTAERPQAEVVEILNRAGIPVGPINSYGDAARDPQVLERDSLQLTLSEDGSTIPLRTGSEIFAHTDARSHGRAGARPTQRGNSGRDRHRRILVYAIEELRITPSAPVGRIRFPVGLRFKR